ncbi:hypothetical protein SAMN05444398_10820 [Roseovarius pacificus]|uniref:Uncharacterized protein n=1 Tax=Roseovarius pacificus TaxID=337701 RepID=A0A1M7EZC3_9RHOB|nr:hypothetical protein GCM10011315_28790 [Roseovarius pacificus]SHL97214.1 hypothetical protein SAMN05444398_10820 [Roseovarius pacificus]
MTMFYEYDVPTPPHESHDYAGSDAPSVSGIVLIGMVCATITAVTAFVMGAGLWMLLLAYTLGGMSSLLLLAALLVFRSSRSGGSLPDVRICKGTAHFAQAQSSSDKP